MQSVRISNFLGHTVNTVIVVMLILLALGLWAKHTYRFSLLSVQTASMSPTFKPGDALIVVPNQPGSLKIGQILSYRSPKDSRVIISHRLIAIERKRGWLTTSGDAIKSADPAFPPTLLIGQAVAYAPGLGHFLDLAKSPLGMATLIYFPAALVIIYELRRLWQATSRPIYRLANH